MIVTLWNLNERNTFCSKQFELDELVALFELNNPNIHNLIGLVMLSASLWRNCILLCELRWYQLSVFFNEYVYIQHVIMFRFDFSYILGVIWRHFMWHSVTICNLDICLALYHIASEKQRTPLTNKRILIVRVLCI